jgi:membrane associated rhomboid family serine protease
MFPLYDETRMPGRRSIVTKILIAANAILFFVSLQNLDRFIGSFGLVPEFLFQGERIYTVFTSMFLHGGFLHLFGNMWFLLVFGENLEKRLGPSKFLLFYLVCGAGSALAYSFFAQDRMIPVIGASGAVSGILGGYLILFSKHRIKAVVPLFYFIKILSIPAAVYVAIWFLYQFLYMGTDSMVAYSAHIGGFLTGFLLILFFKTSFNGKINRF